MSSIYVNAAPDISQTKQFLGNYLGIVVQNNDPDKGGKVQVWVPHVSPTVYKNWVAKHGVAIKKQSGSTLSLKKSNTRRKK